MKAAGLTAKFPFFILIVLLFVMSSCSRYRSTSRPVQVDQQTKNERVFDTNEEAVEAGVYEEFVDSSALKRGEPPGAAPSAAADETPSVPPVPSAATVSQLGTGRAPADVMMGYRVQLGAFNDMEAAQELAEKARAVYGSRFTVYVRFYSPYWKVHAGDCPTRDEAQSLREYLRSNGYPDAFIVQAGIKR